MDHMENYLEVSHVYKIGQLVMLKHQYFLHMLYYFEYSDLKKQLVNLVIQDH